MKNPSAPRGRMPWRVTSLVVIAFFVITLVPPFVAFVLTPADAQVVQSVQGWSGCSYYVRRGDDLFRIGLRHGVSYHYLAQINGIYNPNYIVAGQIISVPCGGGDSYYPPYKYKPSYPPKKVYPPYECPWCQPFDIPVGCAQPISYTVQPGDNLFRIAVYNGSTIQWIRTQNDMWGKVLRPGMVLQIPCPGYAPYPNIVTPTPGSGIITATPNPPPPPTQAGSRVRMQASEYNPPVLEVRVGTTVTWVNREQTGGEAYSVTSGTNGQANGFFASGLIPPGGTFTFTFTEVGSYEYFSDTNPLGMQGTVNVTP
jgi:plastocyanin/LysM repeat protein